jgi:hypothetical protein
MGGKVKNASASYFGQKPGLGRQVIGSSRDPLQIPGVIGRGSGDCCVFFLLWGLAKDAFTSIRDPPASLVDAAACWNCLASRLAQTGHVITNAGARKEGEPMWLPQIRLSMAAVADLRERNVPRTRPTGGESTEGR